MDTLQSQLASTTNVPMLQSEPGVNLKHHSTVAEYHEAGIHPSTDNAASQNINAGREPYLISLDAVEFGVHPFIAVYDVDIQTKGGLFGITTHNKTYWLEPNTLLAWRG
jgi:hypothetical protein